MKLRILLIAALLSGCATMTEDQQIARETKRIEFLELYYEQKEYCESRGGEIVITRNGSTPPRCSPNRDCAPRFQDSYRCEVTYR